MLRTWISVSCAVLLAGAAVPVATIHDVLAAALTGDAGAKEGARGIWLWADKAGLHVRWSSDAQPVLFEGRFDLSRAATGPITRTDRFAGGWVEANETGLALLFSSTSRGALDGFDVPIARGTRITAELRVDGQPAAVELVHLGGNDAHPKESTFRVVIP